MADFSISDAAFAGFRIIKARPKVFAIWVAIELAMAALSLGLMYPLYGPVLAHLQQLMLTPNPAQNLETLRTLGPLYAFGGLVSLIIYPVIYAAMSRAVLRPDDDRFAYLRLGADELRQLGVMVLFVLTMIGVYLGAGLLMLILAVIVGVIGAALVKTGGQLIAIPFILLLFLGMLGTILFVAARLSLGSPLTFDTGRVDLFGSWKLTKGKVWPILGTLLVVLIVTFGLYLVLGIVTAVFAFIPGSGISLTSLYRPDFSSLAALLSPGRVATLVLQTLLGVVMIPLWLTPPAAIYAALTRKGRAAGDGAIEDVFA